MVDAPEFERWRTEADQALTQADLAAASRAYNWAAFLAEQAAQLGLKGLLHGLGQGGWGHDLLELGRRLETLGLVVPQTTVDALARLSRHYQGARYPDTLPGGAPSDRYTQRDAQGALEDARAVLALADEAWDGLAR